MAQAPVPIEQLLSIQKAALLACFWPLAQAACVHDYKTQDERVTRTAYCELGVI